MISNTLQFLLNHELNHSLSQLCWIPPFDPNQLFNCSRWQQLQMQFPSDFISNCQLSIWMEIDWIIWQSIEFDDGRHVPKCLDELVRSVGVQFGHLPHFGGTWFSLKWPNNQFTSVSIFILFVNIKTTPISWLFTIHRNTHIPFSTMVARKMFTIIS